MRIITLRPPAFLASLTLLVAAGCTQLPKTVVVGTDADASEGCVVCVEPHAARIGAEVLARGGHAVDAAVATAFALAVTWPEAGNIGGGGFMLVRESSGDAAFVDYREMAPAAATPTMFLDAAGEVDAHHVRLGFRPVGVPGTVAGLWEAHQRYGRLPWSELVDPARRLAEDGIVVDVALAGSIGGAAEELALCPEAAAIFLDATGAALAEGARLVQLDLARTLGLIAQGGRGAFYEGPIAGRIADDAEKRGGVMTRSDLAAYRAVVREPLVGSYRGFSILCGPPPTSGGCVLLQALNILEGFDLAAMGASSADELHLLGEASRRAFLDRARWLGDPDFVTAPVDRLTDKAYAAELRASVDPRRATPSDRLAGDLEGTLPLEGESTTHFSVVDRDGNAVSNTYTLEESWGAKTVAAGTGVVMNNEMHDFNVTPGRSTRTGRVGTAPNTIAPGKRMLSSMCPAIVTRDEDLILVAGSPGGRTIPSTVLRVVTGVIDHGLSARAAVDLPRVHHGLYPDRLSVEGAIDPSTRADLAARGHELRAREAQGDAHVVGPGARVGALVGAADLRRAGAVGAVSVD